MERSLCDIDDTDILMQLIEHRTLYNITLVHIEVSRDVIVL